MPDICKDPIKDPDYTAIISSMHITCPYCASQWTNESDAGIPNLEALNPTDIQCKCGNVFTVTKTIQYDSMILTKDAIERAGKAAKAAIQIWDTVKRAGESKHN